MSNQSHKTKVQRNAQVLVEHMRQLIEHSPAGLYKSYLKSKGKMRVKFYCIYGKDIALFERMGFNVKTQWGRCSATIYVGAY